MTRKDCERHGLQYYDGQPKKACKVEVARVISGQPLLENMKSEPESARRGSDSSGDVDLFGSIWDNIDSKDGAVERSDERACGPGDVENFTNESTRFVDFIMVQCTFNMIFACNINNKGEYDLDYSDIGFYPEDSTPMNPVITANEVSDGMNFNNMESGIITDDHDLGELKLNEHQNDVDLFHHENDGERNNLSFDEEKEKRKNFTSDETKRGKVITQNMVMFNMELGKHNANQMNKETVVSLQSDSGEKINDEYVLF